MIRILIVEDDESISGLLRMTLKKNGYHCESADDGASALKQIENNSFDLILLDIMLPEMDGYTLLEYIREYKTPVIFITAKSAIPDRVKGLRMGADDYIVKPFDLSELLARIETVLRRYHKVERYIPIGDIVIDTDSRIVRKNETPVSLTPKEYDILLLFARNRNIALYRETIYERVWKEPYFGDTRAVDLHIQRLRKKLDLSDEIQSIYKVGYRLKAKQE
ncbi:MAG: response regulator transcription factor [Clostridiales bacterium]|jgi:two-component system alkaline phosphatase synthesis response regulator PhoP|nr:response regulator transcription factor [Clostridiales bacterium]